MSDVRARLVEALLDKYFYGTSPDAVGRLADVLLSLPGIAIVELPEPLNLSRSDSTFRHDIVAYPGGVMDCDCDLSLEDARSIAAALLAAANAAEQATQ